MTIICMELPSLAQQINSDQERIKLHPLVIPTNTRFIFFLYFLYLCLFSLYVKYIYCLIYFLLLFFQNFKNFLMFRDVPECSGMFHVPCFIDALTGDRFSWIWLKSVVFTSPRRSTPTSGLALLAWKTRNNNSWGCSLQEYGQREQPPLPQTRFLLSIPNLSSEKRFTHRRKRR